jgi:hypothetical protein
VTLVALVLEQYGNPEEGVSPPLKVDTRQRLVKTDGDDLLRAVVNCRVCELAIAL